MRHLRIAIAAVIAIAGTTGCAPDQNEISEQDAIPVFDASEYRTAADSLINAALADSAAWDRLAELTDTFGHRFSGSQSLEDALDWILVKMEEDGLENVRSQTVTVPHWVRGEESVELIEPRAKPLPMLGLGRSIGTPRGGITGEVLVVDDYEDLRNRASEVEGKIVLFDVPFPTEGHPGANYGATVQYRSSGADSASQFGAIASLLRSVGPYSMQTPHTGAMKYGDTVAKIPHAAITSEDAAMLHRMQDRGQRIVVKLMMEAQTLPDVQSRNVIAELRGSELPDEVVVLGGHIDSWDAGTGAMDDAGGSVAAWEAVRLMKDLGLRPRRTVRVVLWTNEENGTAGGKEYRNQELVRLGKHVLAMESDGGVFEPTGFTFDGSPEALAVITGIARLMDRTGAVQITTSTDTGTDIGALRDEGVTTMGLEVDDSRYFWYHHTDADTVDKLDPGDVGMSVAAMAVMAYVVADLPDALPR